MKHRFARGLALALALSLCSCLAYRSGDSRELARPQPSEAPKKSIAVLVRLQASYRGARRELAPYIESQWQTAVMSAFRESGLFSEVRPGIGSKTDLQATVQVENTLIASRGLSFVGAVSFGALPVRHRDDFELSTTLKDRSGTVLGVLRSDASVITWYQIGLAPAALFFGRDARWADALYDLTLDTTAQARRKGLL